MVVVLAPLILNILVGSLTAPIKSALKLMYSSILDEPSIVFVDVIKQIIPPSLTLDKDLAKNSYG